MYEELLKDLAVIDGGPAHLDNWRLYISLLGPALIALEEGADVARALMRRDGNVAFDTTGVYADMAARIEEVLG